MKVVLTRYLRIKHALEGFDRMIILTSKEAVNATPHIVGAQFNAVFECISNQYEKDMQHLTDAECAQIEDMFEDIERKLKLKGIN